VINLDLRKEIHDLLGEEIEKLPEEERKILDSFIEETVGQVEVLQNSLFDVENSEEGIITTIESLKKLLEADNVERDTEEFSKSSTGPTS